MRTTHLPLLVAREDWNELFCMYEACEKKKYQNNSGNHEVEHKVDLHGQNDEQEKREQPSMENTRMVRTCQELPKWDPHRYLHQNWEKTTLKRKIQVCYLQEIDPLKD